MKHLAIIFYLASLLLACSCTEKEIEPISASHGKPDIPTNVQIESIAGGAVISFQTPESGDVLGVKCIYTLSNGKEYETLTSFYNKSLKIEGFVDVKEYEVRLYTVNRTMEISDPVLVKFTPLEAPITKMIKDMQIQKDFGGVQYNWQNPDKAEFTLEFITPNEQGLMQTARVTSTKALNGSFNLRGYEPNPRFFGVLIRDKFDNVSDTIFPINTETGQRLEITPMPERLLSKKKYIIMDLDNDTPWDGFGASAGALFDDDNNSVGHTPQNALPGILTLDIGVKAKISRVVILQRYYDSHYYNWGNPKVFDLYFSENSPSKSGNWDEWTFIKEYEMIKPSGLPINQETEEDIAEAKDGNSFSFGLDVPAVQYIRLKVTKTWAGLTSTHIAEIAFYGDDGTGEE